MDDSGADDEADNRKWGTGTRPVRINDPPFPSHEAILSLACSQAAERNEMSAIPGPWTYRAFCPAGWRKVPL